MILWSKRVCATARLSPLSCLQARKIFPTNDFLTMPPSLSLILVILSSTYETYQRRAIEELLDFRRSNQLIQSAQTEGRGGAYCSVCSLFCFCRYQSLSSPFYLLICFSNPSSRPLWSWSCLYNFFSHTSFQSRLRDVPGVPSWFTRLMLVQGQRSFSDVIPRSQPVVSDNR